MPMRNVTVGYAVVPVTNSSPRSTPVSRLEQRRRREALHNTGVEVTALRSVCTTSLIPYFPKILFSNGAFLIHHYRFAGVHYPLRNDYTIHDRDSRIEIFVRVSLRFVSFVFFFLFLILIGSHSRYPHPEANRRQEIGYLSRRNVNVRRFRERSFPVDFKVHEGNAETNVPSNFRFGRRRRRFLAHQPLEIPLETFLTRRWLIFQAESRVVSCSSRAAIKFPSHGAFPSNFRTRTRG